MKTKECLWKTISLTCMILLAHEIAFSQVNQEVPAASFCGPYALMIAAKAFGIEVNMEVISHLAKTTHRGTSMKGLADAAHQLGLRARGLKLSRRELIKLKPPIIAYVNSNHYLVIEQILDDKLRVIEIDKPSYLMPINEFEKIWQGHILIISPKQRTIGKDQPNMQLDQTTYDFGISERSEIIEHTFTFKNTGNSDLVIRDVLPGCTCSTAKVSKKVIAPGEQAQLFMSLDTKGRWGKVGADADIISNDPDQPVASFTLTGIAKTILSILPHKIELGIIPNKNKTEPIIRRILIRDAGTGDLVVEKVKTLSAGIQAEVIQKKKGTNAEIHLSIIPDKCTRISSGGRKFEEHITIYTNDKKSPEVEVPIRGEISPVIQVYPERFFFGFVERGKSFSQNVTMTNHGTENFKIVKADTNLKDVSVETVPVSPGREYSINARLSSNQARLNIIQGKVTVYTDHPKQSPIEIPVYAIIQ